MYSVGRILKPQGIHGEVKVQIITSFPEHFYDLTTVFIKSSTYQAYSIEKVRLSDKFAFLKFRSIDSRNDAELLRNKELYIPEEELRKLESDEFYIHDLIGLDVYDQDDQRIGEIIDVQSFSEYDLYVLKDGQGREQLLPAVKNIIHSVDMKKKKMVIKLIDGLLNDGL